MTLATADAGGRPAARIVLLRGVDERGFTWYTNRESPKGRTSPRTRALRWSSTGSVSSDRCASTGPSRSSPTTSQRRTSRGGPATASWPPGPRRRASRSAPRRARLRHRALRHRPSRRGAPAALLGWLPPAARELEFWQGRRDRLHDRFAYLPVDDGRPATTAPPVGTDEAPAMRWRIVRLAP